MTDSRLRWHKKIKLVSKTERRDVRSLTAALRSLITVEVLLCCTFYPGTGRLAGWSCLMNVLEKEGSFRGSTTAVLGGHEQMSPQHFECKSLWRPCIVFENITVCLFWQPSRRRNCNSSSVDVHVLTIPTRFPPWLNWREMSCSFVCVRAVRKVD